LAACGTGSFFERSSPVKSAPQATSNEATQTVSPTPAPAPAGSRVPPETTAPAPGDWRKDALARFKKMPDLRR
jgi:hypothetical protein